MTVSSETDRPPQSNASDAAQESADDRKERKARKKVRAAWISFVGRIVAQVIGAAATVSLGFIIANRVHSAAHAGVASVEPSATARPVRAPGEALSVAVLPLDNFTGDAARDYLADGLTEALIAEVAQIRALHVISRTSVMPYKNARKPLPQIARELGVDAVVEGSVVLSGRRVRVTAQLVDARDDRHLWSGTYDHDLQDVLKLQSEVARNVALAVGGALAPPASQGTSSVAIVAAGM